MRPCKVLARGYFDSSMTSSTLLTPRQAADKIGISYPALKHWILAGRIRTVKTPGDLAHASRSRQKVFGDADRVVLTRPVDGSPSSSCRRRPNRSDQIGRASCRERV